MSTFASPTCEECGLQNTSYSVCVNGCVEVGGGVGDRLAEVALYPGSFSSFLQHVEGGNDPGKRLGCMGVGRWVGLPLVCVATHIACCSEPSNSYITFLCLRPFKYI